MKKIFIVGATASGKSSMAIKLARKFGGDILNADAFQIYKGLETLTAVPTREEMGAIKHHLYSKFNLSKPINVADYTLLAEKKIAQNTDENLFIVGGSGLYVKALTHGFDKSIPQADPELRAELSRMNLEQLQENLQAIDTEAFEAIDIKNPCRVIRAIEVKLQTGKSLLDLKSTWQANKENQAKVGVFLNLPIEEIRERIYERTKKMLGAKNNPAIEEVRKIVSSQKNFNIDAKRNEVCQKIIGFREILSYLNGETNHEELVEKIYKRTSQLAKRQITWFKREKCFEQVNSIHEAIASVEKML